MGSLEVRRGARQTARLLQWCQIQPASGLLDAGRWPTSFTKEVATAPRSPEDFGALSASR
jgi:hypothetical protein